MLMNDCMNQAIVRENVVNYLTAQGLPCRRQFRNESLLRQLEGLMQKRNTVGEFDIIDDEAWKIARVHDRKVFGVALRKLYMINVKLKTGQIVPVPPVIYQMCKFIMAHVTVEGIFRKAGSTSRQNEIKSIIDNTTYLPSGELDVIDVAAVLKYFVRQLPEFLIPNAYHKLFIACYDRENKDELLLLATLLLPIENLNLLTYLMEFFEAISKFSSENKMTSDNIAICIAPNIFQTVRENSPEEYSKFTGITKLLIEQSILIGRITDYVRSQINLEEGFNRPVKDNPFSRILNNLVKALMMC